MRSCSVTNDDGYSQDNNSQSFVTLLNALEEGQLFGALVHAINTRHQIILIIKIFLLALAAAGIGDELSYSIDIWIQNFGYNLKYLCIKQFGVELGHVIN